MCSWDFAKEEAVELEPVVEAPAFDRDALRGIIRSALTVVALALLCIAVGQLDSLVGALSLVGLIGAVSTRIIGGQA